VPFRGKRLLVVEDDPELARLVASAAARMGATVAVAGSGAEALVALAADLPDAALVALPVAGESPTALLPALRRAGVPALALSGVHRGRAAEEEVRRAGALRLIEKPFAVEELMAALGRVLAERPGRPGAEPPTAPEDTLAAELRDFDSLIFSPARPALDETVPLPLRRAEPEWLARPPPDPAGPPRATRERSPILPVGELATAPLPRLLAVLYTGQATGALSLTREPVKKLVLFERGAPVLATSNVPRERFGARCVREGVLDAQALAELVRDLPPGVSTAAALLQAGLLTAERRARMVAEQVVEILWAAFDWREGLYRISLQPLPARERVPLVIHPGDLILEGMRRAASLERLRAELPPDLALAPATQPAFELHRLQLRSREAQMLAHADGTKSVRDLVALSGLHEREALAFLGACRHMGLLDEVDRVLASTRRIGFM